MGIDAEIQAEDGRSIERLSDDRGSLAKFLVMVDADGSSCLRFIDPYGDTLFNSLQLPVLEAEITARMVTLGIERLRAYREYQLTQAIRLGWQATVIEELRSTLGDSASGPEELEALKAHMVQLVRLIGRARSAGDHIYVRFIGD